MCSVVWTGRTIRRDKKSDHFREAEWHNTVMLQRRDALLLRAHHPAAKSSREHAQRHNTSRDIRRVALLLNGL